MENIRSIFDNQASLIIVAIGFTVVLISGELDLSIGSVLTFGMIRFTYHANHHGLPATVLLTCVYGGLFGLFNGILVAKLRVDSFIASLASMIIINSLCKIVTRNETYSLDIGKYEKLLDQFASPFLGIQGGYLSNLAALVNAVVVLTTLFLNFTRPGRNVYLVRANERTAWFYK